MAKKFLTLNIGASTVSLAEYEAGAKGALTLVNYGFSNLAAPLDDGNVETILAPALMDIVREKGIKPGKVALSVSGQMVFPKFAAIPAAGGEEKFEQMVRYEIEQGIPFPIDEMVCDRQVLGDTENGDKSVMIVAAKVDQIEAITSAVASVGFTPELVDVAPIAITNTVRYNRPEDEGCVVILDIGAKITSLVIVEGDKLYNRSIPVAGNSLTKEIATALGCSTEEAEQAKVQNGYVSMGGVTEDDDEIADRVSKVARAVMTRLHAEISRSINFYRSQQHGSAPVKLYLTGGSALLGQIDQFFQESLQVEVEYLNPFERISTGPKVDAAALESDIAFLAATAGLAIHQANEARFAINLLPPSIVEAKAEKARIPFLVVGGVTLVAALALVMLGINNETAVVEAQREQVKERQAKLERFDKKVKTEETALAETQADVDMLRKLLASRSVVAMGVGAVRSSLLPGMWIEKWQNDRVTIRYWKDRVKAVAGKTVGEQVVDSLKRKGNVVPESVRISDMSTIGKEGQVEQFTVEVKFK